MNNFSPRNDIERSIEELDINRSQFFEISKLNWNGVIQNVLNIFVQRTNHYQNLYKAWERFIHPTIAVTFLNDNSYKYLSTLITDEFVYFIVEENETKFWVYEGTPIVISKILEDSYFINEYYIVSKKYHWLLCENHHHILCGVGNKIIKNIERICSQNPEISIII